MSPPGDLTNDLLGWRARKLLVTGHSGFMGSWLCASARYVGAEVIGFSLSIDSATAGRARWLADAGIRSIEGDVRYIKAFERTVAEVQPDAIIHLAAQPLVGVGRNKPHHTLETNVLGSLNVFEVARHAGIDTLISASSDKCYRNEGWSWPYREIDRLGGNCPYSTSKAMSELLFETYADLFRRDARLAAASVRFGNVIGGGDEAENRLVPNCLRALDEERPIRLRNPTAVRPFQHVLDVVNGVLVLGARLHAGTVEPGSVFNFAPPYEGVTTTELADALVAAWGSGTLGEPRPVVGLIEEPVLRLDGRLAAEQLDWTHQLDIAAGARSIVAWHRAVDRSGDAAAATFDQVEAFFGATARSVLAARA